MTADRAEWTGVGAALGSIGSYIPDRRPASRWCRAGTAPVTQETGTQGGICDRAAATPWAGPAGAPRPRTGGSPA